MKMTFDKIWGEVTRNFLGKVLCFLAVVLASISPLNLDDPVYYMLTTRFWVDDFRRVFIFPQCQSTFVQQIPLIFFPSAMLSAGFGELISSPVALRIFGIIVALLNFLMLRAVSSRGNGCSEVASYQVITNIMCFGTLPFYLVMARPEGIIFLFLVTICLISLTYYSEEGGKKNDSWGIRLIAILFLISWMFWIHPGAIAFVMIFMLCLYRVSPSKTLKCLTFACMIYIAISGVLFHRAAYECPEVDKIQSYFSYYSGGVANSDTSYALTSGKFVLSRLISTFDLLPYSDAVLPLSTGVGWIPSVASNSVFVLVATVALLVLGLFCFLGIIAITLRRIVERYRNKDHFTFADYLGVAVFLSIFVVSFLHPVKFTYRGVTIYLLAALSLVLLFDPILLKKKLFTDSLATFGRSVRIGVVGILLLYSSVIIPKLFRVAPELPTSVGLLSSFYFKDQIAIALNECDVEVDRSEGYLVDPITLFTLKDSARLSLVNYANWEAPSAIPANEYLRAIGVKGIFAMCESLPIYFLGVAHKSGDVCCWKDLSLK